ncbi:late histone H1 [Klebsiella michiganensis]|nr:late histone H1 [Klebsiella michiganensis]MDM4163999.1 late histone H1 [Klebsiella michiganensis]HBM3155657.1 late histone H1 [Klebsiella michiganensis]HCQ8234511.1 late histone H1 [Klebsiella michiganensis]HDT6049597.1 late histone H1 [Klebsiella michiganensis]
MMKKLAMALGICALMACGAASAANGQVVSKAKSACQNNATQCAQAKSTAKADAQKEAKAAKDACAKNQAACDNAKTGAKNAVKK